MLYRCELCDEMKDSDESGGFEWQGKDACHDCLENKLEELTEEGSNNE